jgi:hypothetical protein
MANTEFALSLSRGYNLAKQRNPSLTKGQYMAEVMPHRYKNTASAERAYNKILGGYTSGRRLQIAAENSFGNPYRVTRKEGVYRTYPIRPGGEGGIWMARITFRYDKVDPSTNKPKEDDVRWIQGTTYVYTSNAYRPYIRAIMLDESLNYIKFLENGRETPPFDSDFVDTPQVDVYRTDVSRVSTNTLPTVVRQIGDIDERVANNVIDEITFEDD